MRRAFRHLVGWFLLSCFVGWGSAVAGELDMEWAYHDDADGIDDRVGEEVPGESFPFLGNGGTVIPNDEGVRIFVLTVNQFAGDQEEQVLVRWWNGEAEHWVSGSWEKNIFIGKDRLETGTFHGLPADGEVMVDLWKVDIGPEITRPGENFYVIQLKGWEEGNPTEYYLLREGAGEATGRKNPLGQAWTADADYFDHDWSVTIGE